MSGESINLSQQIEAVQPEHLDVISEVTDDAEKVPNWLRRNKAKLLLGVAATSLAVTLATDKLGEVQEQVADAAPWVGAGVVASEALFIGGAAMMASSVGEKIGNPLTVKNRIPEIAKHANESTLFKTGFVTNTIGAVGDFAVISAGVVHELPPQSWGVLGLTLTDLAGTVALRKAMLDAGRKHADKPVVETNQEVLKQELKVRQATEQDIERLAEIDLARFKKAYGENPPSKDEVEAMFAKRLQNANGWMFVAEVGGQIEGFVTGFRTGKPHEEFVSWEDSTADGTLDGKVDSDGRYAYVVNMTINPSAMKLGGETALIANLMANAIRDGVEYGYFVSRMPFFNRWIQNKIKNGAITEVDLEDNEHLQKLAEAYVAEMRVDKNGKQVRRDHELRMYEEAGFRLGRVVSGGFQDKASMNFGVICIADIPPKNPILRRIKPLRLGLSSALRLMSKRPKLLEKVL